jgi:hypothetical protein
MPQFFGASPKMLPLTITGRLRNTTGNEDKREQARDVFCFRGVSWCPGEALNGLSEVVLIVP